MNVFAIVRVADPDKMTIALEEHFQGNVQDLGSGAWLVAAPMTAEAVSRKLGVGADSGAKLAGPAMVMQIDDYFGRAPQDIWDWIKHKMEEGDERAS